MPAAALATIISDGNIFVGSGLSIVFSPVEFDLGLLVKLNYQDGDKSKNPGAGAHDAGQNIDVLERKFQDVFHVSHGGLHCSQSDHTRDHPGCRTFWGSVIR